MSEQGITPADVVVSYESGLTAEKKEAFDKVEKRVEKTAQSVCYEPYKPVKLYDDNI